MIETLCDLINEMERLGRSEALRFHNAFRTWRYSYADYLTQIAATAAHFDDRGLQAADRILLWGENSADWAFAFWAAVARGIQVVPLDFHSSSSWVLKIHEVTRPSLILVGSQPQAGELSLPTQSLAGLPRRQSQVSLRPRPAAPDDIVEIVFTSGTTGTPKGVVHRHRNLAANLRPFQREFGRYRRWAAPVQPIRILNLLPLSHLFGQSLGLFIPILLGGAVVFTTELRPTAVINTIRRERVSVLVAVPRLAEQLERTVRDRLPIGIIQLRTSGLISIAERWWRYRRIHSWFGLKFWALVIGGAQVAGQMERFWTGLGFAVIQGYGLTEASPIVAVNHPFRKQSGALGKVLEGQEVQIAADGEILVRGDSVVSDYYGDEETTLDTDGWLHTGDIGELDTKGRLFFRGRKKDVIVTSSGLNVFPEDIERILNMNPLVRDSVVIPQKGPSGEEVHAVLLLDDGEAAMVVRQANARLEPHQRIRSWSLWSGEDFPRTSSTQKVKRHEVAALVSQPAKAGPPLTTSWDRLGSILRELSPRPDVAISDSTRLEEDLGLGSLDRIELLSRLEQQYGLELPEAAFTAASTLGEIQKLLQRPHASKKVAGWPIEKLRRVRSRGIDIEPTIPTSLPRWNRRFPVPWLRAFAQSALMLPLYRHYLPLKVEGLEHLSKLTGPVLFAVNHTSHLDTLTLLAALPRSWRGRVAPAMLQEFFLDYLAPTTASRWQRAKIGLAYYLACGLFNAYPIPQQMGTIRHTLRYTGELVQHGYCPLIFPEGVRSRDGQMRPFQRGVGLMALRLRIPVIPVLIQGLSDVLSVEDSWPRPGPVGLSFGAPLVIDPRENAKTAALQIEKSVRALLPQGSH